MEITLHKLTKAWFDPLYEFEHINRAYFETMVPARADTYYHRDFFEKVMDDLLIEQDAKQSYFFLIVADDVVIGRINLTDIDFLNKRAEVGYRIGEKYAGKGLASKSVQLLQEKLKDQLEIRTLYAKTLNTHLASQKILTSNGFQLVDTDSSTFEWKGSSVHFLHFEWNA
ncbi:ribosomal-protein-alanine N-acetyltransferase [Salirhabdus euzebyi]|uniref:Ribosomal-protein-alanine N-acetyltransferase n=1 Tax=Salirhabdus euzebyi TaxID=394506 RepID=A0A841Q6V0_9BACI|nr:GNAT family N-acetyltransferase [Salirhabdus euzebyi]MBB6454140.1 ribosomal-protein-alanine N-acetyltransferase [Salirhabdus euzebyi]